MGQKRVAQCLALECNSHPHSTGRVSLLAAVGSNCVSVPSSGCPGANAPGWGTVPDPSPLFFPRCHTRAGAMTASGTLMGSLPCGVGMAVTKGWGQSWKGTVPVTQSHHHPSVPQGI